MVDAAGICGGRGWTPQREVPFEEIRFLGFGVVVR